MSEYKVYTEENYDPKEAYEEEIARFLNIPIEEAQQRIEAGDKTILPAQLRYLELKRWFGRCHGDETFVTFMTTIIKLTRIMMAHEKLEELPRSFPWEFEEAHSDIQDACEE